ncbi:MAG: hypothetical protein K9L59_10075 [Desulfobacterales bacterium]|nr:hypothetical protein [Desulfobacterales bacterium]
MTTEALIPGGFVLLSRKIMDSGIMEKPPLYMKLWIWMLLRASHKDHGSLKRGQLFTTHRKMQAAMTHKVGFRKEKPSIKEIRGVLEFLTISRMVVTMKGTHGTLITILNYDKYQTPENYEGHYAGHRQGHNNNKNDFNKKKDPEKISDEISLLRSRYSNQNLIDRAFRAVASTRKTGKVADSVLLAQLQKWDRYPVHQVEAAIRVYLEKECATEGKDEKYLCGIIRNQKAGPPKECTTPEWL